MTIGKWTPEAFDEFDRAHPHIYEHFRRYAIFVSERRDRYSAKAIFHRVRWEIEFETDEEFKIDDGWISHYARKFIDEFPDLDGFFQMRNRNDTYHD